MPGKGLGILVLLVEDGIVSRDTWMRMASILVRRSVGATMSLRADIIINRRIGSEIILIVSTTGGN
jgi:hypothetical protein